MDQADQLDLLKLLLEANNVEDPVPVCQQLDEHGVTTLTRFAELSWRTLVEWRIAYSEYSYVCGVLRHAQRLLVVSSHDLAAIRQQLMVRARMHYRHLGR